MRTATRFLVLAIVLGANAFPARADDSDIFGRNVQPNVMILVDSSGSMADEIVSSAYAASTTYTVLNKCRVGSSNRQPCASAKVWQLSSSRYTVYRNTIAEVSSSTARDSLTADGHWAGRISGSNVDLYVGNYINYISSSAYVVEPKIDIAKRVITGLLNNTEGVRFGIMKFGSSSGQMVSPIGTSLTTMVSAVNAMTVTGSTPTGEQLRDAGKYFKGTLPGYSSPIQMACQPNFIIIVSDGDWNGSIDPAAEATLRRTQDHATGSDFPGTQAVYVHTVGFGSGLSAIGLGALQDTATNGGGNFYTAETSTALEEALQSAIRQIATATFTFASPVIPTTSASGSDKIYMAAFQTDAVRPFWRGFLRAYRRETDGTIPVDDEGVPLESALAWEAGNVLSEKAASTRTIYTAREGSLTAFTTSNSAITAGMLGVSTTAERDNVINFTRGLDSYDEDSDGNFGEERPWKLGDIFHSNPVVVKPPFLPLLESSYQSFKTTNSGRTTILLAGSNDGMLHAFRETDGAELWAFIPPDMLGRLKDLAARSAEHTYFLDSSPIVADIKIDNVWKTIVVFGERRGGTRYHALDITNTTSPSFLWTFEDTKLGESWSEPSIAKVRISGGASKYVAIVGGGYDTTQNNQTGKAFFVIDLATGAKLWEYYNNSSSDDRRYMNFSLAANPAGVDLDSDGYINRVYVGDVGGQLWKFDLTGPATLSLGVVTNWTGKRLFAASPSQANPPATGAYYPDQAIYSTPSTALDSAGNLWVYFGTGDRNHPNNASTNRFYGIKDNTTMTNGSALTESSLVDVTSVYKAASQGWYFRLASTEKVLAAANVFNGIVFFSTFTPGTSATCLGGGGTAKLCAVGMTNGYAGVDWSTGHAVTTAIGANDTTLNTSHAARSTTVGTGIASKPIVIIGETGATVTSSVIAATTDQQLLSNPAPPPALKRILYWREVR